MTNTPSFMSMLPSWLRRGTGVEPVIVFIIVLVIVSATRSPAFLTPFNLGNLVVQLTPLLLVTIGQTYAVGSGGLDLSVGSIVSVVAVITAVSFEPFGIPIAVTLGLGAGLAVGVVNGALVGRGIEPFLVTLATLSIAQGVALFINPVPRGKVPAAFSFITSYWGTMPVVFPILLLVCCFAIWSVKHTRLGMHVVGVGGNRDVARLCGIEVPRVLTSAYVISAGCAALAALFLVARTSTGDPTIGARFTIDSLAAVVLGGTALGGGRVTMLGAVLGAIALGLLSNALNLLQVPAYYQAPVKGVLVIGAVLVPTLVTDFVVRRRAKRAALLLATAGGRSSCAR